MAKQYEDLAFNGKINVNEYVFDNTKAEEKLEVLNSLSIEGIRKVFPATILRIINECKDDIGNFRINNDRRAGNNWNSTIEYLYIYKNRPILMLYVQGGNTDTSTSVSYNEFNSCNQYHGHCKLGGFIYDSDGIADVIRCILSEYVYYTDIEKAERKRVQKFDTIAGWRVVNPVYNYFYEKWDCWHRMKYNTNLHNAYNAGKKAVEEYAKKHTEELYDKPVEELQTIYKQVFEKAANW